MKQNLYVRASFLSFLLTIVALFHANSQASLKSYKDSSSGKFGFKNKLGQIAVPAKYQDVGSFSNKLAPVKYLDKWG
ncbi:MAG TPA: WG repeat-containing protein, partial [Flavitalea sp.]|nr:WG repeat-containing protein [Flavitalea sp.]